MGFSKRLKLLRKNADVTQDELAQYLQVSRSTIAGYETKNRQPDYDKLYMIAQFFHVSTDYLISGSDIRPVEVSTVDSSMNERMLKYHLRTIYATLSLKSKQDLLEYARLLRHARRALDGLPWISLISMKGGITCLIPPFFMLRLQNLLKSLIERLHLLFGPDSDPKILPDL